MKPLVRYTLLAIASAIVAFAATRFFLNASVESARSDIGFISATYDQPRYSNSGTNGPTFASDNSNVGEVAWLQTEFRLTADQTSIVAQLHDDYQPVCMTHCRAIIKARAKLTAAPAAEQAAARAELTRLEAVCHDATLAHLKRVAAVMAPDQGARFLALVEPKLSGQNHAAPLGLK